MSERQYITVRFSEKDWRTYTYHNDGAPVAEGDRVEVQTVHGIKTVVVALAGFEQPPFQTKPIIGMATGEHV